MSNLAALAQLQYWLGLPRDRMRIVWRFIGMAITLAAAKVFLNTVGFALFLTNEGASQLPRFYLVLALAAITLSAALGVVVDRVPKLRIARATLVAILILAGMGKWMIDADIAGAYFIILSSAFIFEIAIEILFWASCAAYLDTMELKRATPLICLAIALGGAFGGWFARALAWRIDSSDLLLTMLVFACLATLQFALPADIRALPDGQAENVTSRRRTLRLAGLSRVCSRYPLLILLGLNALTLTILYGIAEFLILSVYSEHYPTEQELTRFLGMVFALLQGCEFLLLASLSRVLLERTSPLLRNLVFPLTSLVCLVYLALSNKLSAAVITHINAEAASNAIFQPIHNANFLALPLAIQGRARTLSEGVFYPAGLAIAGAILWSTGKSGTTAAAEFIAILFALAFILLNVGTGLLFQPTLIARMRSGAVPLADIASRIVGLSAAATDRVREFLHSPVPGLQRDGIALTRWLGPARVADDLVALASHPDMSARRALVRLAIEQRGPWVPRFVDAAFGRDDHSSMVAMQVMLAHREAPSATQAAWLAQSKDPSISALAWLLVGGSDPGAALERVAPLLHQPQVASDIIEGIVAARREDCAAVLVAALPAALADQQRQGLEFLHLHGIQTAPSHWRVLGRFVRHPDPWIRAEAVALLGQCRHRAALRALSRRLADQSPLMRRRAADALATQGDHAVDPLHTRLVPITLGSTEAAGALSRMGTEPARRALSRSLQRLRRDAGDNARLLGQLGAAPEWGPCRGLATCVRDHQARITEIALAILSGTLQRHIFGHVSDALRSEDRSIRANAFEVLASVTRSGIASEAVETLRIVLFESGSSGSSGHGAARFDPRAILALARASPYPWVHVAARIVENQIVPDGSERAPVANRTDPAIAGSHAMNLSEQDLDRVLVLKRIPLFRYLPLDTLLAVSRSVRSRRYLPGEVIVSGREQLDHCHILETGAIAVDRGGASEPIAAPACLNELVLIGEVMPIDRIVAREPCQILLLHAVVLQDLSRDHPEILLELCRILARRIRAAEGAHRGQPVPPGHSHGQIEHVGPPPYVEPGDHAANQVNLASEAHDSRQATKRIFKLLRPVLSKSHFNNE